MISLVCETRRCILFATADGADAVAATCRQCPAASQRACMLSPQRNASLRHVLVDAGHYGDFCLASVLQFSPLPLVEARCNVASCCHSDFGLPVYLAIRFWQRNIDFGRIKATLCFASTEILSCSSQFLYLSPEIITVVGHRQAVVCVLYTRNLAVFPVLHLRIGIAKQKEDQCRNGE